MALGAVVFLVCQFALVYYSRLSNKEISERENSRYEMGKMLVDYIEMGRPRRSEIFYSLCNAAVKIKMDKNVFIKEFGPPDEVKTLVATGAECYIYYVTAHGDDEYCSIVNVSNNMLVDCGWSNKKWWNGAYR